MTQLNLKETLGAEPLRARVIDDCVGLIDAQVAAKSGFSGAAIKTAYATVKRVKRGFVPDVVNGMLDEWMERLQPHFDVWRGDDDKSRGSLSDFLTARSDQVAEDLLAVTDARAETSKHKTAKKAYLKLRSSAKGHVIEAIPALGRMVEGRLTSENLLGASA
ncbi:MAG: hypothetical protein Tsb0020_55090 [Haliangiales bacterium]